MKQTQSIYQAAWQGKSLSAIDALMAARDEGYHIYDGDGYEIAPEGLEVVYDDDDYE